MSKNAASIMKALFVHNTVHARQFCRFWEILQGHLQNMLLINFLNSRCHTDTSKIILVSVRRSFHGNYSCQGRNRAGWGPESEPRQLKVLYPPRGAILTHKPAIIRKGAAFEVSN